LSVLKRKGIIETWQERRIIPGADRSVEIDQRLEEADIILLLVSADLLASDYCFNIGVMRALSRHSAGEARVIPVIVRPVDWTETPFARLQPLPASGKPVVKWEPMDDAWLSVAHGIRQAAEHLRRDSLMRAPTPWYSDERERQVSERLEAAYVRLEEETAKGADSSSTRQEIVELKRALREGPQLATGDFLGLGRYRLLELIDSGAFGSVWRAYDRQRHRLVAVKVLHGQHAHDRSRIERFFRGAQQMASLTHPGVVQVFEERGRDGGYYYFVMEYLPNGDLHRAVLERRLTRQQIARVILDVGDTLQYAHARGLVHRDVKPANILLSREGLSKLSDFDLVRVLDSSGGTRTGLGTLFYSAPETMMNARSATPQSDIFSLGMSAIFGLYGQDLPPAAFRNPAGLIVSLDCPEGIKDALERAVRWEPQERFPSMLEFCRCFERGLHGLR
jgi:hypothetical protein